MKKRANKIIGAFALFIIAILIPFKYEWINKVIFLISYFIVGFSILKKAFRNLFRGKLFDENFLMSLATIGAFFVGEFPEAVAVMLFYQVGELFQSYAVDKSRKSIAELMDIRPDYANIEKDNEIQKVDPDEVKVGEIIIVKPGEKIPLDGVVVDGNSVLDTKALTGESVPRNVFVGSEILSGCINQSGVLKIEVTKEFGESTVSKILDLVENASSKKSKSEKFITKFARIYTPIVVIIAVILAIVPPLILTNATFNDWIYRALSFLVVSCPCALVISIPLSFFGGLGAASKIGILIKGSNYLESLANTEIVVFDKTGTLTEGTFEVQKINATNIDEDELLKITAYAENYSTHPIAESIKKAYKGEIDKELIQDYEELAGRGIKAKIGVKTVLVGNSKLMEENSIEYVETTEVGTILYIAIDNSFSGYILISDKIKEDSERAIKELKQSNIKQAIMLTGDRKDVAEDVAQKLKIDKVYSELLPDQKAEKVEELLKQKNQNAKLAFVGDGINDAPVLAISDIGIAMGALGSDAAIEAADIVIMTDEPSKIIKRNKIIKKDNENSKAKYNFCNCSKNYSPNFKCIGSFNNVGSSFCRCRSCSNCDIEFIENVEGEKINYFHLSNFVEKNRLTNVK